MPLPLEVTLNDIAEWCDAPMHRLSVRAVVGEATCTVHLYNPRTGSSWEVEPVTARGMYGDDRVLGWMVRIRFICLQNDYESFIGLLDQVGRMDLDAVLVLAADDSQQHGRIASMYLKQPLGIVWAPVRADGRPSFEVRITKAINSLDQYTGLTGEETFWNPDTALFPPET